MRIHPWALAALIAPSIDGFTFYSPKSGGLGWTTPLSQQPLFRPSSSTELGLMDMFFGSYEDEEEEKKDEVKGETVTLEESDESSTSMEDLSETVTKLKEQADEANDRAIYAEKRVEAIEASLAKAQSELQEKEQLLKAGQDVWAAEKATLAARIAEFTQSLQNKDQDVEAFKAQAVAEAKKRQEELQGEIDDLKMALEKAQEILAEERQGAADIKNRLLNAEDVVEFEQMKFEKEKTDLGMKIKEEKERLQKVEKDFAEEQKRFQQERSDLQNKIKKESSKLTVMKDQLGLERIKFDKEKKKLEEMIKDKANAVAQQELAWKQEKNQLLKDKKELEQVIDSERNKLVDASNKLASELARFEKERSDLEGKIQSEKQKLDAMVVTLEREQEKFLQEKSQLQERIDQEKDRITQVERELAKETSRFRQEKAELEQKIADGIKERKLKAKQMNERFTKIREEMTTMLVETKNNARKELTRLKDKYTAQIAQRDEKIQGLESEISYANEEIQKRVEQLKELRVQKKEVLAEQRDMEKRFIDTIAQRNGVIYGLEKDVKSLENIVADRDDTIDRYESSFRQQIALSAKLTGKRIVNSAKRVRNIVKRKEKDADKE